MNTTRWWAYVMRVTDNAGGVDIARKAEFDPSAVSRWKRGENPRWDFVLKFARAYGRNVLEALTEAGFITESESQLHDIKVGVADLTTVELLEEVLSRLR
ncbi:XRE family transcriptional regulator [Cryobacterium sp. Hh11]|uniref:helix-turn-helix domain-containing protein n=1 Tax=Cryobacterium sp. Hh11 TaxID=2555868 RepID=UPI001069CFBF|nr:helix-turn-helix transcriptional regulator [Cryobacterium sp. Hh11]TFD51999.1 XRE family transcriptional regulator [Cryobacterium sp. Hh11]